VLTDAGGHRPASTGPAASRFSLSCVRELPSACGSLPRPASNSHGAHRRGGIPRDRSCRTRLATRSRCWSAHLLAGGARGGEVFFAVRDFAEVSLPVMDFAAAQGFWEPLGFVARRRGGGALSALPLTSDNWNVSFHPLQVCERPMLVFRDPADARAHCAAAPRWAWPCPAVVRAAAGRLGQRHAGKSDARLSCCSNQKLRIPMRRSCLPAVLVVLVSPPAFSDGGCGPSTTFRRNLDEAPVRRRHQLRLAGSGVAPPPSACRTARHPSCRPTG